MVDVRRKNRLKPDASAAADRRRMGLIHMASEHGRWCTLGHRLSQRECAPVHRHTQFTPLFLVASFSLLSKNMDSRAALRGHLYSLLLCHVFSLSRTVPPRRPRRMRTRVFLQPATTCLRHKHEQRNWYNWLQTSWILPIKVSHLSYRRVYKRRKSVESKQAVSVDIVSVWVTFKGASFFASGS